MSQWVRDGWRRWQLRCKGVRVDLRTTLEFSPPGADEWAYHPDGLSPSSVVYSFGVGQNIRLDLDLIHRFGLTVHAFDPTPKACAWLRTQSLPAEFRFHPIGIAAFDGEQTFYAPRRANSFDYTSIPRSLDCAQPVLRAPVRRLSTLMRELGHGRVDLLKLDIEGGEYAVIADLARSSRLQLPAQVLVEFHHNFPAVGFGRTLTAVRQMQAMGYHIAHISRRGLEFLFYRPDRDPTA